jgi:hypothetical protein
MRLIGRAGWDFAWLLFPVWTGHDHSSLPMLGTESRSGMSGVTPSDACGLGRASSSAKGWVLAMLARKGGLRVALVPRKGAPFSPAA